MRFIHTADIHLGKTYKNSPSASVRYEDFFIRLAEIVEQAVMLNVDCVLIAGDLFHTGQILPKTFAKAIEVLSPLKQQSIPCIAVEGNHDWIHRRNSISWMEALSELGYIHLLRPERKENGEYVFQPFDFETGAGGRIQIGELNIYGIGYIGTQAGAHVEKILQGVETENNILLFHVGIWKYSPVEIGNMQLGDAHPLAEKFSYVALGHGHKPYTVETPDKVLYGYNPGAPERVNFGEQKYDKGFYLVDYDQGIFSHTFITTNPRPMFVETINLDGLRDSDACLAKLQLYLREKEVFATVSEPVLLELILRGKIPFHPFELSREKLVKAVNEVTEVLHVEVKNRLSQVSRGDDGGGNEKENKSLADLEEEVVKSLIGEAPEYKEKENQFTELALAIRKLTYDGDVDDDEILELLEEYI